MALYLLKHLYKEGGLPLGPVTRTVKTGETIVKDSLVYLDTDGLVVPCADGATLVYGVATEAVTTAAAGATIAITPIDGGTWALIDWQKDADISGGYNAFIGTFRALDAVLAGVTGKTGNAVDLDEAGSGDLMKIQEFDTAATVTAGTTGKCWVSFNHAVRQFDIAEV